MTRFKCKILYVALTHPHGNSKLLRILYNSWKCIMRRREKINWEALSSKWFDWSWHRTNPGNLTRISPTHHKSKYEQHPRFKRYTSVVSLLILSRHLVYKFIWEGIMQHALSMFDNKKKSHPNNRNKT